MYAFFNKSKAKLGLHYDENARSSEHHVCTKHQNLLLAGAQVVKGQHDLAPVLDGQCGRFCGANPIDRYVFPLEWLELLEDAYELAPTLADFWLQGRARGEQLVREGRR
jgi:hypothetical protein